MICLRLQSFSISTETSSEKTNWGRWFCFPLSKTLLPHMCCSALYKQNHAAAAGSHTHEHTHTHTCPAKIPQTPMMQRMLKTAEPTMVPTPTSPWVMKTPAHREVANQSQRWHQPSGNVCVCVCVYVCVCACVCISLSVPMTDAKSSGAELPAAMKVAPATSSLRSSFCRNKLKISGLNSWWQEKKGEGLRLLSTSQIFSSDVTKYSSQTMARARNM